MFSSYQVKCLHQGKAALPSEFLRSLSSMLVVFFNASLQPPSREMKITVDRMDAYANAFFAMILLDNSLFHQLVQQLVANQVTSVQPLLTQCLHALCTDRSVSMINLDKKNRQLFVQNFREFINQVRALPIRI